MAVGLVLVDVGLVLVDVGLALVDVGLVVPVLFTVLEVFTVLAVFAVLDVFAVLLVDFLDVLVARLSREWDSKGCSREAAVVAEARVPGVGISRWVYGRERTTWLEVANARMSDCIQTMV